MVNLVGISNQGHKFTFVKNGETDIFGGHWKFKMYQYENSQGDFLTIYETNTPVNIDNSQYLKFFDILTQEPSTNKVISSTLFFISNSPETDEGQNDITPEEAPN